MFSAPVAAARAPPPPSASRGGRAAAVVTTAASPADCAGAASGAAGGRKGPSGAARGEKRAVVIGGGVGGLATAGRLAASGGFHVTILEKNAEAGGRLQSMTMGGCRFDTGPSLLLFKDKYEEGLTHRRTGNLLNVCQTFKAMGTSLEDHVRVRRVEPAAYRVFFAEDNSSLDLLYDVQAMFKQLEDVERGAGNSYLRFLAESRAALDLGTKNFIERDFNGVADFLDLAKLLPLLRFVSAPELLGTHDKRMARRFRDKRLRAMFTFQDLYVGLSPYTAPGVFSLLAATELTDGVWYPEGGFCKVRDGLQAAAEANGVTIQYNTEVSEILVDGSRVRGVRTANGEEISADLVICNRDVAASYELLQTDHGRTRAEEVASLKYSAGVIAFNWCISKRFSALAHHNIFLSDEYKGAWNRARDSPELQKSPNFYVHVPSRSDPSAAPEDADSVMVLLPVANALERRGRYDYSDLIESGREAVLDTLQAHGLAGVRNAITEELVIDPKEWAERYGLKHGAAFGLSHGLSQLAVFRPGVADGQVAGLYFCGASARPGNGVPLVMIGSRLAHDRILRDAEAGLL